MKHRLAAAAAAAAITSALMVPAIASLESVEDRAQPQPQVDALADAFVEHGEVAAKEIGRIAVGVGVQDALDLRQRESEAAQRDEVVQASEVGTRVAAMAALRSRGRREQPEPVVVMQARTVRPVCRARSPTRHVSLSSVIGPEDVTA